ncbi:MAG TPA: AraC family transcriptional regulator, partial [Bacilli bacterium]|nr:AraC family transcriptional regulator [Bacilli bacterium]
IPPPLVPRYYPDPLDPWTYVWIGFGGINAEQYMELANLTIKDPIIHDDSELTIRYLMEKLHESFLDGGYLGMNCLGICYQVVSNLIKIGHRVEDEISQPKRHVKAAKDYILNNFQLNITISDIASNAGVTTNYLAYIFKQVTGVSPKQFLTSTRITRACNLLRVDAYPIKEIAKLVGYSNQLHFSSSFKKAVGVSPLQYRRKERDE